jgi:hypothetical protein
MLDPVYNAANVAELAVEKGATILLIPIFAQRERPFAALRVTPGGSFG